MAKHGTRHGYSEGCRCTECVAVNTAYVRRRRAGLVPKRAPYVPVVKDFSGDAKTARIVLGEKRKRTVSSLKGAPIVTGVLLAAIGCEVGEVVELEYLADCVIIRRVTE